MLPIGCPLVAPSKYSFHLLLTKSLFKLSVSLFFRDILQDKHITEILFNSCLPPLARALLCCMLGFVLPSSIVSPHTGHVSPLNKFLITPLNLSGKSPSLYACDLILWSVLSLLSINSASGITCKSRSL